MARPLIYDCFLYYDEDMLLEIRFNTLAKHVDYFVIVESEHSFTGKKKNLNFDISKFEQFKDQIIYVPFRDKPKLKQGSSTEYDAWRNESDTRNAIMRGLKKANNNDIIIVSDVDEILRPEAIKKINPKRICTIFHMPYFNYQFNLQVFNPDGKERLCKLPRATTFKNLHSYFEGKPEIFRNIKKSALFKDTIYKYWFKFRSKIIQDSGWHFSWIMTPERISEKMSTISHTEYDLPEINNRRNILQSLENRQDLWGRDRIMKKQEISEGKFPAYIVSNRGKYKDFIL